LSNVSGGIRIIANGIRFKNVLIWKPTNGDGFGPFDKLRAGKLTTSGSTKLTTGAIKIFRRGWECYGVSAPVGGRWHGLPIRE